MLFPYIAQYVLRVDVTVVVCKLGDSGKVANRGWEMFLVLAVDVGDDRSILGFVGGIGGQLDMVLGWRIYIYIYI